MNLGSELPVDGNSLEQFSQSFLLKGRQLPTRHLLMFARDFGNSGQSFFSLDGKILMKRSTSVSGKNDHLHRSTASSYSLIFGSLVSSGRSSSGAWNGPSFASLKRWELPWDGCSYSGSTVS